MNKFMKLGVSHLIKIIRPDKIITRFQLHFSSHCVKVLLWLKQENPTDFQSTRILDFSKQGLS